MSELEARLRQMQQDMSTLQRELQGMRSQEAVQKQELQQNTSQHQQLEERVTKVETTPPPRKKQSLVFFRGGYTDYVDDNARGFESFTDTHDVDGVGQIVGKPFNNAEDGWYVGGSIEHSLTDNLWGLWPGTEALGEISLEYKNFGSEEAVLVVPAAECSLLTNARAFDALEADGGCLITGDQAITMFTVSASPKIKFLEGSKLRPWIIPAGLDFHVISPPSDAATYLDVGVQFAAGVEYEILPGIKAGIDGRYHLTANISDTENNTVAVLNRELGEEPELLDPDLRGLSGIVTGDTDRQFDFWTIGGYVGFTF
jgi:hypothetical protein